MSRRSVLAAALAASLATNLAAQPNTVMTLTDFETKVSQRFGAERVDLSCAQSFDSASPVGLAMELGMRIGAHRLLQQLSSMLKQPPPTSPQQSADEIASLRHSARYKVWLPVEAEALIGEQLNQRLGVEGNLLPEDQLNARERNRLAEIRGLVEHLVAALPPDQPYRIRVVPTRQSESSMAVQMGGLLYVSEGLLRDRQLTRDDLVLRTAHEISHLTKRHVLRDFQTKAVDSYAVAQGAGKDLALLTQPDAMLKLVLQRFTLAQTLARKFDHFNEFEADSCGVLLMKRAGGFDIATAIRRFEERQRGKAATMADMATHPPEELRVRLMQWQLAQPVAPVVAATSAVLAAEPASGAGRLER